MSTTQASTADEAEEAHQVEEPESQVDEGAAASETIAEEPAETAAHEAAPATKPEADAPADEDGGADQENDPVKAAIDRLRADAPVDADVKPTTAKPASAKPAAPAAKGDPAAPADAEKAKPAQPSPTDDPIASWNDTERRHTKGSVKERFRALHRERTELAQQVETLKPDAEVAQSWNELVDHHALSEEIRQLNDTQVAFAIRGQATITRVAKAAASGQEPAKADLDLLVHWHDALSEVVAKVRGTATPAQPAAAEPEKPIEIPQDLKDLRDIYGAELSDDDLRALAANRAKAKQPAAPAKAAAAPTPPASQPAAPRPQASAPTSAWSQADYDLARNQVLREAARVGKIEIGKANDFVTKNVDPIAVRMLGEIYPGVNPSVAFRQLGPGARKDLLIDALREFERTSAQRTTPAPPRMPSKPIRSTGARPEPQPTGDPVQQSIARLRSD